VVLADQQHSAYLRDGYIKYGELLTPPALALLKRHYIKIYDDVRTAGLLHNVAVQSNGESGEEQAISENLQIHYMCHHDEVILAFLYSKRLLDIVQDLIGPDIRLFFEQGFWKPPLHGAPTNWHQDNGYFKLINSSDGVGCWIALDDATKDNGCMWVIPGSHRETYTHYRDITTDHLLRTDVAEEQAVTVELKAGECMFFEFGVLHQTKANTTDTHRRALALHFSKTDAASLDQLWFTREKRFAPILRGSGSTGGLDEFGAQLNGRWEEAVQL
jgi:ectoine hydroxylase-related dioxygenase (phytanoyl-CoA dioxygenase family)